MGERSKAESRKAEIGRKFEAAKSKERRDNVVRCQACGEPRHKVPIMVEMGRFVFCSQCITAAYGVVEARKAGR